MNAWKLLPVLLLISACGPSPHSEATVSAPAITDRKWTLLTLGKQSSLLPTYAEAAEVPITFQMHSATSRAWGYSGCIRYSARYMLRGDSVQFMEFSDEVGCSDLAGHFLKALKSATHYEATDSTLTLLGPQGPVASFGPAENYRVNGPVIPLDADLPGDPVDLPGDLK